MTLFENGRQANIKSTIAMVEDVLLELGHFVNESRVPCQDNEEQAWEVTRGSALVRITLLYRDSEPHLRASSYVMTLDERVDKLGLFRHLLTLNRSTLSNAAFALDGFRVQLLSERTTMDLDRSEVLDLIRRVELYADEYDDRLVAKFGGLLGA